MSYLKYFTISALFPLLFFYGLGLFIQPVIGALTRVGHFAERDFGWNAPQPQIKIKMSQETSTPSVLVLGDSFSDKNVWQSIAMEKNKLDFLTFSWVSLNDPGCLKSWILTLKTLYPTVKVVLIETIERSFLDRLGLEQRDCRIEASKPIKFKSSKLFSVFRDTDLRNAMPDPIYAICATLNMLREFKSLTSSGSVFVTPLTRSDLFSNKKSSLMVYYQGDRLKMHWNEGDVQKAAGELKKLQTAVLNEGLTLMIAVVPDKSTAYEDFFKTPQFQVPPPNVWDELHQHGVNQVDLKQIFKQAVEYQKDFYLPNDTHLSNQGYIAMGNALSEALK